MATSGSADFQNTRDQIIQRAYLMIGQVNANTAPNSDQVADAVQALNSIVKNLQAEKIYLWALDWMQKTFTAASQVTGTDALVYTCIKSHTSASANRPVTGANWSTFWKQTGSTGGAWVTATGYTSTGDFPVDSDTIGIEKAFLRKNGVDTVIATIGSGQYLSLAEKGSFGDPIQLWFDNKLSPTAYLYPQLEDTDDVIHYLRIRRLEDYDAAGNTSDFPVAWEEPLTYLLAYALSFAAGMPLQERQMLRNEGEYLKNIAKHNDTEVVDEIRVSPRMR